MNALSFIAFSASDERWAELVRCVDCVVATTTIGRSNGAVTVVSRRRGGTDRVLG